MKYKVLVLGKGYMGEKIAKELDCGICVKRVLSLKDAQDIVDEHKPNVIINCIGHTGARNVDDCEIDKDKMALHDISTNAKTLEKFGRERYLMKKDNEDIFLVIKEKKE